MWTVPAKWWISAVVAASTVAVLSWWQAWERFTPQTAVLLAVVGAAPLVLGATLGRGRTRTVGWALLATGGVAVVLGVGWMGRDGFIDLRLATVSWRVLVRSTHVLTPVGLAALGTAVVLAGVAALLGRRGLAFCAAILMATVAVGLGLSVAAGSVRGLAAADGPTVHAPGLLLGAALLATAVVAALATALDRTRDPSPRPPATSRTRLVRLAATVGVVAVLCGAAGAWWWQRQADRLVIGDVFPDPALAACVAETLGKDGSARVSGGELEGIRSLSCVRLDGSDPAADVGPLTDLNGLESLENLASLELTGHQITDLSPLSGLDKLGALRLTDNAVADLGPLADLPVLTDLGLSRNQIADLSPLAGAGNLRHLGLADNQIADLGPLAGATMLSELDVSRNAVSDLSPLARTEQLERLTARENHITDPSPLSALPWLTMLDVGSNDIEDTSGFGTGFPVLNELWLGENPVATVEQLTHLPSLAGVDLEGVDAGTPGIQDLLDAGVFVGGLA